MRKTLPVSGRILDLKLIVKHLIFRIRQLILQLLFHVRLIDKPAGHRRRQNRILVIQTCFVYKRQTHPRPHAR